MKKGFFGLILCLLLLVLPWHGAASSIPELWNTGIGDSGSAETHYTVDANAQILIGIEPILGATYWQYPANPQAQWIYLTNITSTPQPPVYTYSLKFDLTGYDPASASFSVRWMMDNAGYVTLNGIEIPGSRSGAGGSSYYQYLEPNYYGFSGPNAVTFSNSSYFLAGINQLDFVVLDGGGATGLYVEFTGSSANAVPLPAAAWLLGSGLIGLAALKRRFRQ